MISTHTPVKGVTKYGDKYKVTICISTHTPVKGVTLDKRKQDRYDLHFNSHAREGRDPYQQAFRHHIDEFQLTRP